MARSLLGVLVFTLAGCAWHRVTPAQVEPPSRLGISLGLEAQDAETSLTDLKNISATIEQWRAASRVQFPWRAGDDVDFVAYVRLRQTLDRHEGRNVLVAVATGLTLFVLSCCVGLEISEVHDVDVRFVDRDGAPVGSHSARVVTAMEFGPGADLMTLAKATDQVQVEQLAKLLTEWLQEDLARRKRDAAPAVIKRSTSGP